MGLTNNDPSLIKKRHGAYVLFLYDILLGIASYVEWASRFILNLALHLVDVLEALAGLLLQVFRVIKLLITTLFTFGVLLRFMGRSFGAVGSFLFVLSLLAYFCWREDGSVASGVSGVLHINACVVKQIDLLVNYDKLYDNESEFTDKSTMTKPRIQATGVYGQGTSTGAFVDKGTETELTSPKPFEMEIVKTHSHLRELQSTKIPRRVSGQEKTTRKNRKLAVRREADGKKKSAPILTSRRRARDKKS